ncbi:hypothetical protein [Anaerosporobacter sp.]|uniref:hypothetical protein n=1 Tax=Anaerosporobacter sp. TaxID=1872529 RepID=UPI00286F5273|nr:hypothetical protein [Anaerosporobacter sp.]
MDEPDSDSDADTPNRCIYGSIPAFFISKCRHAFLCAYLSKISYNILQPISFNTILINEHNNNENKMSIKKVS